LKQPFGFFPFENATGIAVDRHYVIFGKLNCIYFLALARDW